jgi:uncharacterized protein
MRLSRYLVAHPQGDNVLLFATRSAEFLTVSRSLYTSLASRDGSDISSEALALLSELKVLVEDDEDELTSVVSESRSASSGRCTLHMVVVPTSACPLGCNLEDYGGYCGQKHGKGKMTREDQLALIRSLRAAIRPFHSRVSVSWFGGEPLAALDVVRTLSAGFKEIAATSNCAYYADLTTGGTLLTREVARECFLQLGIGAFSVSIDGSKEEHDKRRCTKGGQPTYDRIMKNVSDLIEDPELTVCKISIRCNVDKRNIHSVPSLIDLIADKGWQERVDFYFVPVHHWSGADSSSFRYSPSEFAEVEMQLLEQMIDRGFTPYLLPEKRPVVCRVVSDSNIVVGHDGAVHKCTESPLTPLNRSADIIGRAGDTDLFTEKNTWRWHDEVNEGKQPCSTCTFLPVCGGGCPLAWHRGDQPCPSFKFNINDRLALLDRLCSDSTHTYQNVHTRPDRDSLPGLYTEYEPLRILESLQHRFAIEHTDLVRLRNYLKSARQKARDGLHKVASYQFNLAESLRMELAGRSPRTSTLLKAASRATAAYLLFKAQQPGQAIALLKEACIDLQSSRAADPTLDVLPAQLQALANMVKVHSSYPGLDEEPKIGNICLFLQRGGSLPLGPINLSFNSDDIEGRYPGLLAGLANTWLRPRSEDSSSTAMPASP